jgi:PPK2 family polyphosphate:nucleotide phosphotransferase
LTRHRPDDKGQFESRDAALQHLKKGIERLRARQELLYAQNEYALLLIFQGMDASGKDSAIKHVMSGINPQGTEVHSFKAPSTEELSHDFLWRAVKALPGRGRIGIFNRSYYEEVLVVRVHPELLASERLPASCVTPRVWRERFEDIGAFERYLSRNGTIIRKFFLYVSRSEQRKRLLERLDDPAKNWKFSAGDLLERAKWHRYMSAYRDALAATSRDIAPWYVIPADHKWFAHVVIADIIVKALDDADLSFPKLTPKQRQGLLQARRQLVRER